MSASGSKTDQTSRKRSTSSRVASPSALKSRRAHGSQASASELVPALDVEVKDGFVHDYLNLNKDGDPTSCETIEHLMDVAAEKLRAVST